jgi:hypothetical protein
MWVEAGRSYSRTSAEMIMPLFKAAATLFLEEPGERIPEGRQEIFFLSKEKIDVFLAAG